MVGSTVQCLASIAHLKSPRIASRKFRDCAGVSLRRSRPATIVSWVIWLKGIVLAEAMTCLKMFSRCRLVAAESAAHALESRYLSISHANDPANDVDAVGFDRFAPATALRYSASNSGVPNSARMRTRGPWPFRTYHTGLPCCVVCRCRCGGRGRGIASIKGRSRPSEQGECRLLWMVIAARRLLPHPS